jgi:hypothetical protein
MPATPNLPTPDFRFDPGAPGAAAKPLPDIHIHNPDHAPIVNPAVPEV